MAMSMVYICVKPAENCGLTKTLNRIITEFTVLDEVTAECHTKLGASGASLEVQRYRPP